MNSEFLASVCPQLASEAPASWVVGKRAGAAGGPGSRQGSCGSNLSHLSTKVFAALPLQSVYCVALLSLLALWTIHCAAYAAARVPTSSLQMLTASIHANCFCCQNGKL